MLEAPRLLELTWTVAATSPEDMYYVKGDVSGSKTINVFDREDREDLTEQEVEHFSTVDNNSPRFQPGDRRAYPSEPLRTG